MAEEKKMILSVRQEKIVQWPVRLTLIVAVMWPKYLRPTESKFKTISYFIRPLMRKT